MIVVDASAGLSALLNDGAARALLSRERLHAPHLVDVEVISGLRRQVLDGRLDAAHGSAAVKTWQHVGMARYPVGGLAGRVWELRDNLSAYDACYVALAESLGCMLVTADVRLSNAAGPRCPITVLPR